MCMQLLRGMTTPNRLPKPRRYARLRNMSDLPHADVVGSMIRPSELLAAREDVAAGRITPSEFKRIEDAAVDGAVAAQEAAGFEVLTDGEMRRLSFQSQMPEAVDGFGEFDIDAFLWGDWRGDERVGDSLTERPATLGVVGELRRKRHLSAEEFTYLRGHTTRMPKVTLPSPSLFANFWSPSKSVEAYPTLDAFLSDVAQIIREEIEELIRLGATYIQLDAPHYPLILDPTWAAFYESQGRTGEDWIAQGIELDNAVMDGFTEATFAFHLCRGNQGSRWLAEGGYDRIVEPVLQRVNAHRLMLEYDDERSGSFEPLRGVPNDKTVALGLVTTKSPRAETPSELADRITEAAQHFPREQLAISPQCGFGTSIVGNRLTIEEQNAKLRVVAETAQNVWG